MQCPQSHQKKREATKQAIAVMLAHAVEGRFGTPDNPLRNGGERSVFWACYFGYRKSSEYKGTISYPSARAGELYRKKVDSDRKQ